MPKQQICELFYIHRLLYTRISSTTVSKVDFEDEPEVGLSAPIPSSPTSGSPRHTRLTRFLSDLGMRPNDPPHDLNEPSFGSSDHRASPAQLSSSLATFSPASASNPEADSFAYMETLLESLAVLGKLGSALDNVVQRLSGEIFTLVETTLDEVEERAEYGRRGSIFALNGSLGRSEGVYVFSSGDSLCGLGTAVTPKGGFLKASSLRLAALEPSAKQVDHEILNDLFWTLYSKLDAVAQGLRVIYEVANRVGSVSLCWTTLSITHIDEEPGHRGETLKIHLGQNLGQYFLYPKFGCRCKLR